eukprot:1881885-Amphidinium_carterae.1
MAFRGLTSILPRHAVDDDDVNYCITLLESCSARRRRVGIDRKRTSKVKGWLRRCRRISRVARVGKLVKAGAIPALTWSSSIVGWPPSKLHRLQDEVARVAYNIPLGAHAPGYLLARQESQDALELDVARRHHREITSRWAECLWHEDLPRHYLWEALTAAAARLVRARQPWAVVQGPCSTLLLILVRMQIEVTSLSEWITPSGFRVNLHHHSPGLVARAVSHCTTDWLSRYGALKRRGHDGKAWLEPLHAGGKALCPFQAAVVANQAAYGAWCQDRLWKRNLAAHPLCLLCGAEGTVYHRMITCPAWEVLRCTKLSKQTRDWVATLDPVGQQCVADLFTPWNWMALPRPMAGEDVRWVGQPCRLTGHIFMDGAAYNPRSTALRRAGWALCQIGSSGELVAGVYGYLPFQVSWEHKVRDSEDYCTAMLARFAGGQVQAYTDCKGTYKRAQRGQLSREQGAKQVREHLWQWQGNTPELQVTWHKVKAHLTEAEVKHDSYLSWCRAGNEHADRLAKAGAAWHLEGQDEALTKTRAVSEGMKELAVWVGFQAQVMADQGFSDHEKLPPKRNRGVQERHEGPRNRSTKSRWSPPEWLRQLANQAPEAMPRVPMQAARIEMGRAANIREWQRLEYCGYNHALHEYAIKDDRAQRVGALVACQRCGAYQCHRSKLLKRDCMGPTSAALKSQLRRIQGHQHPLAQSRYQGYQLQWCREVSREEVMHELTGAALLHQVYV